MISSLSPLKSSVECKTISVDSGTLTDPILLFHPALAPAALPLHRLIVFPLKLANWNKTTQPTLGF